MPGSSASTQPASAVIPSKSPSHLMYIRKLFVYFHVGVCVLSLKPMIFVF